MTTALLLVAFGVGWRLLISPDFLCLPNAIPISALALYAAIWLPRRLALVVPVATMLLSDLILDQWHGYPFDFATRLTGYAFFALVVLAGRSLDRDATLQRRVGASLIAATGFFLVSNLAVWLSHQGFGFPMTVEGLISNYNVALPFFRNNLIAETAGAVALFAIDRFWLHAPARDLTGTRTAD